MRAASEAAALRIATEVIDLAPPERDARLRRACGDDAALRREVEALLAADTEDAFLRPLELAAPAVADLSGERVGAYRLTRVLATGGMGTVYEAEQDRPRRSVAIKMIRAELAGPREVQRFLYESEVLARLRHPGIAQVFGAGTHPLPGGSGRELPWFAMELVEDARPILAHAREGGLALRERLALFCAVCDAVQHGHQKGVIHRDLKPGNLLVDAAGRPKVIDFGVARPLDADERGATLRTRVGQVLGTLRYMSPEQIGGDGADVDVRTDVWALGVVLHELLCDRPPHDLEGLAIHEAARVVSEVEPRRPSASRRSLPAELDWIVLRALEKERERRYPSVAELASDVRRFLRDEPVAAGPPRASYRARKFVRRHRALVASAGAVVLALVVGLAGLAAGLVRARAAADEAASVRAFFERVLAAPAPGELGRDVLMADVLRTAARDLEASFAERPAVRSSLHLVLGRAFQALGELGEASGHFEAALALSRAARGPRDPESLRALRELGGHRWEERRFEEARALLEDFFELAEGTGIEREDPALWLGARNSLAVTLAELGEHELAREILADAGREAESRLGAAHAVTLSLWNNLARSHEGAGRMRDAEELLRRVVDARADLLGADDPKTLIALDNLGWNQHRQGRCVEAETTMRKALAGFVATNGPFHPDTSRCRTMLGRCLFLQERFDEAEPCFRDSVAALDAEPGPESADAINARYRLARALFEQGRAAECEEVCRRAAGDAAEGLPPGHHLRAYVAWQRARALDALGRRSEAIGVVERAIDGGDASDALRSLLRELDPRAGARIDEG